MNKLLLITSASLVFAASASAVTVRATDFPRNSSVSSFTTTDGLVNFQTTNTFSGGGSFLGDSGPGATANLINAYNGAERLTMTLEAGVSLESFGLTFTNSNLTISGFSGDPGLSGANAGTAAYNSRTNELTFRVSPITGAVTELTFANPETTDGATLVFSFSGTQATFTSFTYEPSTEPAPTPLVAYSFDNGTVSATAVSDVSGNNRNGTLVASADAPATGEGGIFGESVRFASGDSPQGVVNVPATAIPSGADPRTFSLWFNADEFVGQNTLLGYGANSAGRGFEVGLEAGGIRLRHYGGNITFGQGFDFLNADAGWHHLAVRVNAGATTFAGVQIFLDGVSLPVVATGGGGTTTALNTTASSTLTLAGSSVVGSIPASSEYAGRIDEFAVWDTALISPQIITLAQVPPAPEIASFRALPQNRVPVGTVVPLVWDVANAATITLTPSNGDPIDVTGQTSFNATINELVSYTLTVTSASEVTTSRDISLAVGDTPYPNVVIFFLDDFGWADWEQNGAPDGSVFYETPTMNRLAAEGLYFENGYASAPVCSPTRAALLTGTAPAFNKLTDFISGNPPPPFAQVERAEWTPRLDLSLPNLARTFSDSGYRAINVGKWHLGSGTEPEADPLNAGYDVNIGGISTGTPPPPERYFASENGFSALPRLGPDVAPQGSYLTDVLTEQAVEQIRDAAADDTAFILKLSHYAVHTPLQAPAETVARYDQKLATRPIAEWEGHTNTTYAAMIEHVDRSLNEILSALEDPDGDPATDDSIAENTLVVFTADNGGLQSSTSNRPLRNGKGGNYDGGIREPWILWRPGTIEPGISSEPIVTHDLFPTLLTHAGIEVPSNANFNGVDLTPLLTGEPFERQDPIVIHYPHWSPKDQTGTPHTAIIRGEYKLIYDYQTSSWELYNIVNNPGEDINLINSESDRHQVLSWLMLQRLEQLDANFPRTILSGSEATVVPGAEVPFTPLIIGDQDDDGDGKSNLDEVIEGTDPANAQSFFRINPLVSGQNFGISFNGLRGRAFDLEASENLLPDSWITIESISPLSVDSVITIDELTGPESRRFFRIRTSFP